MDGRVLEYCIYGSTNANAALLIQITGTAGTAKNFLVGSIPDKMKELNIQGLSITVPGHAYSTVNVGRKIVDFALDVDEVLEKEGLTDKKIYVEGTSYGTSHAMAIANHRNVEGIHLQLPYLPRQVSKEENIESKISGTAINTTQRGLQSCTYFHYFCLVSCMCCCLDLAGSSGDFPELPEEGKYQYQDIRRAAKYTVYGLVFNATEDHVFDWGFDPRDVKARLQGKSRVLISYAEDDTESPPEHGEWFVKYFDATANPGKGKGHDSFSVRMRTGEQVQLFHDTCMMHE